MSPARAFVTDFIFASDVFSDIREALRAEGALNVDAKFDDLHVTIEKGGYDVAAFLGDLEWDLGVVEKPRGDRKTDRKQLKVAV